MVSSRIKGEEIAVMLDKACSDGLCNVGARVADMSDVWSQPGSVKPPRTGKDIVI